MFDPTPGMPHGYGGVLILIAFLAAMVWIVWLGRRRSKFDGISEVSGAEQAILAQEARAFYVDPQSKLCDPEKPSEFDVRVLALFDSIERNGEDIDTKLEDLRVYLKGVNPMVRAKDKFKLRLVYAGMAAYLARAKPVQSRMGRQQLLANWRKVGRLVNSDVGRAPQSWIRPLTTEVVPTRDYVSGGPSRGIVGGYKGLLVGALFFSVSGAMIAAVVRPNTAWEGVPVWIVWGIGIFIVFWIACGLGWIRPYGRGASANKRSQ